MKKILSILFAFTFSMYLVKGQNTIYIETPGAAVTQNSHQLLMPWCGGINATQIQKADLNKDGIDDLVIYDHITRTIKTFINQNSAANTMDYKYEPKYAKNFPDVWYYLILKDYNCDGIADLFHRGSSGIAVHKGYFDSNNELKFTFFKELYFPGSFGQVNAYVQPNDIPSIEDIDFDGDLDFLSFDVLGSLLPFYKNMQVENNLPCDSIQIIQFETCWGQMYQTYIREHVLNASCKGGSSASKSNKQRHTGNCILHIDIDGDSDMDLLGGNVSYNDAQILYNGGNTSAALISSQDTTFEANGHQLEMKTWPAIFYTDIDNDGKKDLLFTPHLDDGNTANYNAIAFYKNTGTTPSPVFQWTNDSLLINEIMDFGRNSFPALFDYDKDGKLDLFVGSEGYFNTQTDQTICQLAYYKNTSTQGTIAFELVDRDFLNLSTKNYKGIYPTWGDVTGDGIIDLVLGNNQGSLAIYENISISNSVQPNLVMLTDSISGIDVGEYSFPLIYDYNKDGKNDILIGNQVGNIALYNDSSISSTPIFKRVDSSIGDLKCGSSFTFFGYATPYIGVLDGTPDEFLLVGTADGTIERYSNFLNSAVPFTRLDSNYSKIQVAQRSAFVLGDLDGNGYKEMIVGSQNGGLQLFTESISSNVLDLGTTHTLSFVMYPQPATDQLFIQTKGFQSSEITLLTVYDLSGRRVANLHHPFQTKTFIDFQAFPSGFYLLEIEADGLKGVCKVLKQ